MSGLLKRWTNKKGAAEVPTTSPVNEKPEEKAGELDSGLPVLNADQAWDGEFAQQRQTAFAIMAETLYRYAQRERFFSDQPTIWNGVALRLSKGQYVSCPSEDPRMDPWINALAVLNCEVSVGNESPCAALVGTSS